MADVNGAVRVAIVGAGDRSEVYASYALHHPNRMHVVAVAEPDLLRRAKAAEQFAIPPQQQFDSYQALVRQPKLADAVINGTMDRMHYESSVAVLSAGYHLLLEKPIAPTEREVRHLIDEAVRRKRVVMICHVLRYAPFYQTIKQLVDDEKIGKIVAIHTSENVSYHHMATAFVRGQWNCAETSNPMILAKCCHDFDIIAWLMTEKRLSKVASLGSLYQFRPENAPAGSADRCLNGCAIESTCEYSARRLYLEEGRWGFYVWKSLAHLGDPTIEQKLQSLRTDNPYGRCVWRCDNDVVDHQTVIIEFDDGTTVTHNMFCATSRPTRTIHILGSHGEIEGDCEGEWIKLRTPSFQKGKHEREEMIPIEAGAGREGHGGGDIRLVEDFVSVLRGEPTSRGVTRIEDSLTGHLMAFDAEVSRREGRVVTR